MILVTGPTGSGKTSTLYTALNSIKSSTNNIITLEDPIEMQIPGVNQMQINAKAGVTFASGLRSILRQDPNVILVGEIRDQETADIALGAAQTGHLLLSTLHTNDATATITRLFDLGIQPFLIASSLLGIVAQRLVRRPCPACAVPPAAERRDDREGRRRVAAAAPTGSGSPGAGCDQCGQSGLKGRIAIHEVLAVNDEVRDLISSRARRARDQEGREAGRDADAARGRHRQGRPGSDHARRSAPRRVSRRRDRIARPRRRRPPSRARRGAGAPTPSASRMPPRSRGRVLVVEDSPTIVSVVKYFLELEGFEVLVAEDGLLGPGDGAPGAPGRHRQRRQHAGHGRRGDGEGASRATRERPTCAS